MPSESKSTSGNYLLILSCSKRKKNLSKGAAVDVYDGPFFQILRKHQRPGIDVLILSAKYGLLEGSDIISPYDLEMTSEIAEGLKKETQDKLESYFSKKKYDRVLINLGKKYVSLVLGYNRQFVNDLEPEILEGPIGFRNYRLKKWLLELEGS